MLTPASKLRIILCILTFAAQSHYLLSLPALLAAPCDVNDICETAIVVSQVQSDHGYVCVDGCNLNASPDPIVNACQMGDFPTVWYEVDVDDHATIMNIEIKSSDFDSPVISLFDGTNGCDQLEQINLTNGTMSCLIGSDGKAMAVGTAINPSGRYFIAVSSLLSIGGDFTLCVSTIGNGSNCVVTRSMEITARSNGGSLSGPFDPGETVSVCMNVIEYTAAGNGCQWFQGMVPYFGNGWDPLSFDTIGQPLHATVNGNDINEPTNGLYGASTWGWDDKIGYHHDNTRYRVGDFDNNGRIEMCNAAFESDCPNIPYMVGGCCGPCWSDPGDLLPPGWFAQGINGTCPTLGSASVDWGDGNTCGGGMGPWHFCFDLITREKPDCLEDSTRRNLTLGFYTFADGETGAWTGGPSVCALDQPLKMSFKAQCGRVRNLPTEILPDIHEGDTFKFPIAEDGVSTWEWNVSPARLVPMDNYTGKNGVVATGHTVNNIRKPQHIKGIFIGHETGSSDLVLKRIEFNIYPNGPVTDIPTYVGNDHPEKQDSVLVEHPFAGNLIETRSVRHNYFKIFPMPARDEVTVEWPYNIEQDAMIRILNADGKVLSSFPVKVNESNRKSMGIRELPAGVYFINFETNDVSEITRIVKM